MGKPKPKFNPGKGRKMSNVKRANITTNKRLKERRTKIRSSLESKGKLGGFVNKDHNKKRPKKAMLAFAAAQKAGYFQNKRVKYQQEEPEEVEEKETTRPGSEDEEILSDDMEEEDLAFIQSLGGTAHFLADIENSDPNSTSKSRKASKLEKENQVAAYEERPRKAVKDGGEEKANLKPLLPIKHSGGLEYRWIEKEEEQQEDADAEEDAEGNEEETKQAEEEEEESLPSISTVELFAQRQEKLAQKKQHIATLASSVLEDPEKNIGRLKDLTVVLEVRDPSIVLTTRKLAMVSLAEVFKDIAPGYRIREWGEKAKTSQVQFSKDVMGKRTFEEGLVTNYRRYLEFLEKTIKEVHKTKAQVKKDKEKEEHRAKKRFVLPDKAKLSLAETATQCMCSLLNALPHFNYRTNIISVLTSMMTSKHEKIAKACCVCIKQLFRSDPVGDTSLEAVQFISRNARNNGYQVEPEVLYTFLSLRIKEVKTGNTAEENHKKMLEQRKEKFKRLSRSQKRYHKRLEVLEKELQATEATESKNKRLKLHTQIIEIVFATYFRILKRASHSMLLPSVLEGLAKFAHVINVEFFDDLIHVLLRLVQKGNLKYRESLHCTLTAFHILSGQGDVLNIDPSQFYAHLYATLRHVHAGESSVDAKLVCECLETMFIKRRKQITFQRVLGFLKRLASLALTGLPNAALAYLCALKTFMKWYPKTDVLLDTESVGSGTFLPEIEDPEHSHAQNTTLWELSFMQTHYHRTVRQYAAYVSHRCPTKGHFVPELQLIRMEPKDLLKTFSPDVMKFNPPLPPKQLPPISKKSSKLKERSRVASDHFIFDDFEEEVTRGKKDVTPSLESMNFSSAFSRKERSLQGRKQPSQTTTKSTRKRKLEPSDKINT